MNGRTARYITNTTTDLKQYWISTQRAKQHFQPRTYHKSTQQAINTYTEQSFKQTGYQSAKPNMFVLHTLPNSFIVDIDLPNPPSDYLLIDRITGKCSLESRQSLNAAIPASSMTERISGIFGIATFLKGKYLIVINQSSQVGTIMASSIKMITNTKIIPFNNQSNHPNHTINADEDKFLNMLTDQLKKARYYFSYDHDLTHSMQRSVKLRLSNQSINQSINQSSQVADEKFFWNRYLCKDLISIQAYQYILPCINGYIFYQSISAPVTSSGQQSNHDLTFLLISRRSTERAGKRFIVRGIDEKGGTANFAETEQILISNQSGRNQSSNAAGNRNVTTIQSFVQVRGSIPLMWEQPPTLKYTPKIVVNTLTHQNQQGFTKHFDGLIDRYGRNICINLINQKGAELVLVKAFTELVNYYNAEKSQANGSQDDSNQSNIDAPHVQPSTSSDVGTSAKHTNPVDTRDATSPHSLSYTISGTDKTAIKLINWDFHHECKGMKFENVNKLIKLIDQSEFDRMGWFQVQVTTSMQNGRRSINLSINQEQNGVFRSNCIDCLDRTNVVQAALAKYVLTAQLASLDQASAQQQSINPSSLHAINQRLLLPSQSLTSMFNNCWANNADAMSIQYSGTGALKTDFTRTGKRTLRGALADGVNSVRRYYYNNFRDGFHQDSVDLMLGVYQPSANHASPFAKNGSTNQSIVEFFARFSAALLIVIFLIDFLVPVPTIKVWKHFSYLTQFLFFIFIVLVTGSRVLIRYGPKYVDRPRFSTNQPIKYQ